MPVNCVLPQLRQGRMGDRPEHLTHFLTHRQTFLASLKVLDSDTSKPR
ncbi:MAG TPA: hypothetical protein VGB26_06735 [Nitrospiria bacterium]